MWALHLNEALPEVARRAGRDSVERLAAALTREDPTMARVPHALASQVVAQWRAMEHTEVLVEEWTAALDAGRASNTERATIEELIHQTIPSDERAAWVRALDRHLDASALLDRWARRVQEAQQVFEYAALALSAEDVATLDNEEHANALDAAMVVMRGQDRPWVVRVAAVHLVGELASREGIISLGARQALLDRVWAAQDQVWVRSEALEAYLPLLDQPEDVDTLVDAMLAPGREQLALQSPDACFIRGRAARLAADHGAWHVLRRAIASRADPSEHVRIELVRALARSTTENDITFLQQAIAGPWRDGSERVQAAAAIAALPEAADAPAHWILLLHTTLTGEVDGRADQDHRPSPWVVETVLEALLRRCQADLVSADAAVACRQVCGEALDYWRQVRVQADLADHAAWILLWLHVQEDDRLRAAWDEVRSWASRAPEGAQRSFRGSPAAQLDERELLDVMSLVAAHGYDLVGEPGPLGGWVLSQGTPEAFSPWRWWYEATHPRADKRQGHSHTVDRVPTGTLLALSTSLSEVTATSVPGRRIGSPTQVAWGAELPLPSHLITAARRGAIRVRTPRAAWFVRSVLPRPFSSMRAHGAYAEIADLRERLLAHPGMKATEEYDRALGRLGFEVVRRPVGTLALPLIDPSRLMSELFVMDGNTVGQLVAFATIGTAAWAAGKIVEASRVRSWRKDLRLVIGGWGSRGKSGTERLKAALFHGLGYSVLAKTTGCEAMVVCSTPGRIPIEIPLYRPYDKATIVEQQNVMELASGFKPQVFLWECMGLRTDYVDILQQDWMRDDFTTLTNTYPDHEDIQGPTGVDVARSISRMIGGSSEILTTEQHMLPMLTERAREVGAPLSTVAQESWRLLPRDLLARFPYNEHPRNISLVVALAERLGIQRDVALKAAADHVVPDLGVLKTWGPFPYDGRTVSFINGCSANERAGFLSNWSRMAFDRVDPGAGLLDFNVTMINNRADRPARQEVFAQIVALDVGSDAVAIIGTNVGPFADSARRHMRTTLRTRLADEAARGRPALVKYMGDRLRRVPLDEEGARSLMTRVPEIGEDQRETMLQEAYRGLDPLQDEAPLPHDPTRVDAARRWLREVAWLYQLSVRSDWDMDAAASQCIDILVGRMLPLTDSALTGDAVLHRLAHIAPPDVPVRLLGAANIKGTGFGFVQRCLSVDRLLTWTRELKHAEGDEASLGLRRIAAYQDYGVADAGVAVDALRALVNEGRLANWGLDAEARQVLEQLEGTQAAAAEALSDPNKAPTSRWWHAAWDVWDGVSRRRGADRLYRDLANGHVGMEGAARVGRALMDRQKV